METTVTTNSSFADDVREGLTASPKHVSSKYFYDQQGDQLFQQIMHLKEYYLTDCELEIFQTQKETWLDLFREHGSAFSLVDFGAGDGLKTKVLLEHFLQANANFRYLPVDISANAVDGLVADVKQAFPALRVEGMRSEYFAALRSLSGQQRNVILFLGSNIGNFSHPEAIAFLRQLADSASKGDLLLIGFDLKKDPAVILDAYNDASGVTRAFNLNLLRRINRELGGHFDLQTFMHYPTYDPMTGEARSYLVSTQAQRVRIEALETEIEFDAWEAIYTETSQKYTLQEVEHMAKVSGFQVRRHFFDQRGYFVDSVWEVL
ncbi:dimethylhistidine N-methyltransferase [Catalinimonas alkaloidigena]|uniref:Dimethylhistidine N-methyltransferase n=1 Tax=Catalinimonas alkaloidigena TaxID=1075417 RepID=A0A1G9B1H0_9BACT|nr:L-histidine N(alpha)-methyltransferase [Catalinimonas alkaloidigena]SDK33431.1 dimethylhistidine N-methyltransferase [Catalinimonas alkaloidigena]